MSLRVFVPEVPRAAARCSRICWRGKTWTRRLSRSCPSYPWEGVAPGGVLGGPGAAEGTRAAGAAGTRTLLVVCSSLPRRQRRATACLWLYRLGPSRGRSSRPLGFRHDPTRAWVPSHIFPKASGLARAAWSAVRWAKPRRLPQRREPR